MSGKRIGRIISYALSRVEAYLIVGIVFIAVVVAIIGKWPFWVILASIGVGVVLLLLLILDSLSDPDVERDASLADVDVGQVRDPALRAKVRKALEYVRAAHKLSRKDTAGVLDAADAEMPQLEEAARSIYQMCMRLQEFRGDRLLQRDLSDLQQQKTRRGGRLTADQEDQLTTLQRLNDLVRSADREIDGALAHLGRSYAEMQAIKVTPEIRGRVVDTLDQLKSSTKRLADLAQGYDEVYGGRAVPGGS